MNQDALIAWGICAAVVLLGGAAWLGSRNRRARLPPLAQLLNSVTEMFFTVDRQWRLTFVNEAAARFFGRPARELVGRELLAEFPQVVGTPLHDLYVRAAAAQTPLHGEAESALHPGVWLESHAYPSASGLAVITRDITLRSVGEKALRASEQRFRTLIEQAGDAIFVHDTSGRFTDVSRRACESLGYTRDELLRMHMQDIELTTPEDPAPFWLCLRQSGPAVVETRHRRKDGSLLPVEVRVAWIEVDGEQRILAIARDVTDRLRAEEALRSSEERYRVMVEGSRQVFFFAHDELHRFTYLSPSVEAVLGYPADELLGMPFDVLHVGDPSDAEVRRYTELALETGQTPGAYRTVNRRKDGTLVPVEIVESPILRDGVVRGLQGFVRDISDRVRAEAALRASEAQLQHAQKMEAVGRLAGGIAHDFNNLLTGIVGSASLLLEDLAAADPRRRDVQDILASADRGAALVRQMLAFSRKQILRPEVLHPNTVLHELRALLARVLGEDLTLDLAVDPHCPHVRMDRTQLDQIVMNLAVNARDAMPAGGRLEIGTRHELAAGQRDGAAGYAVLTVADSGEGMSDEVRQRMYEPFFTTKEPGRGTGLGLATVYAIVQQYGGEIDVESAPGAGTRFTLRFPAVAGPDAPEPPGLDAPCERGRGETILVVEDEEAVRTLIVRTLQRNGFRTLDAPGVADGLRIVELHGAEIDLVLTDVVMPEGGGRELADCIGRIAHGLPVIFMSGYTEDEMLRRGLSQGAEILIEKPFTPAELVVQIRAALARRADGAAPQRSVRGQ